MMSGKKVLRRKNNSLQIHNPSGSDFNFPMNDAYFVNLSIVKTSKSVIEITENQQKNLALEKVRSSKANKECSEEYFKDTLTKLSRRDRIQHNSCTGNFTKITPILSRSITRVLIYGSPGTGKTTLCKKIVHDFYSTDMWNHLDEVIWIPLRNLKDSKFDDEQMDEKKLLKIFLNQENLNFNLDNVLFILDGWDEIQDLLADPKRVKLAETINKMKDRKNLILTSRPYIQLNFADFQRVLEITGFNNKNVRDYIKTFLRQNNRLSDQEKIMEYIKSSVLSDLVTIPIILEIFLFAWQEISLLNKNDITTTKLYKTFILKISKTFLHECGKDVSEDISLKEVINGSLFREFKILREMGKKWLEDGSLHFVYKDFENTNDKLESKLPFLDTSCSGKDWKNERSEFIHLTVLEFFAAFDLINRQEKDFHQFVAENKFNPRYFLVFTFAAGLIQADLHNLKEYNELPYRYSKEEKLDLYFDYLQSDPIDLCGKYIYTLLIDCLQECKLSKSREGSIYQEIAKLAAKDSHSIESIGFDGRRILETLRRFPPGLINEYLKISDGSSLSNLCYFPYSFPQFTDEQVEKVFKSQHYSMSRNIKLVILSKQRSYSSFSVDAMLKLINFDCLRQVNYSGCFNVSYSNLPFQVLEKIVKLLANKDLFKEDTDNKGFNPIRGISCSDAIKLCSQLVDIDEDDSIQDIIVKLILSVVDEEILYFLETVYDFLEEMPEAILKILNNDKYEHDANICKRVLRLITLFDLNSPELVNKVLHVFHTDDKLKYQALRAIAYMFCGIEIPTEVASLLLKNFKPLLDSEKERLHIQNRLVQSYLNSIDRRSIIYCWKDWNINKTTFSMKEFVNSLKGRCKSDITDLIVELFLGTPVTELPLEILEKQDRTIFKILPFIVETKTPDGNLNMKNAITSIVNSKENLLRDTVTVFDLNLICETIKEILDDITGKERNTEWKWTMKRIFCTLTEIQRYKAVNYREPKCAPKFGDEKCVSHSYLLKSGLLQEFFESEDIKLDTSIDVIEEVEGTLLDTLMYLCYQESADDYCLAWKLLLYCGVEDSEFQDKLNEHLIEVFSQELEIEFRAEMLYHLSWRVHRMTKEQLTTVLRYAGEEKDYEFNENTKEDRVYLLYLENKSERSLKAIKKFIKNCEYFSEEEESELRQLSNSYEKYCKEESDSEIEEKIEKLCSQITGIMNKPSTKEIMNEISDYMKHLDVSKCDLKLNSIDPEMSGYTVERHYHTSKKFFQESLAKQFIVAHLILEGGKYFEFANFEMNVEKMLDQNLSLNIMEKLYEKFDDNVVGAFFVYVLANNYDPKILLMVKSIHEASSEQQKSFMTYALVQRFIYLRENIPKYILNNDLYIGGSISDQPVISNLNENQRECLFNAKSLANSSGYNIQLYGIAPKIEAFKNCIEKCTVLDLGEKEQVLKYKTHLDLSNQNIKEIEEMKKIFNFVKKYPVETLILSNNQINGEAFEVLFRNADETHLKYLILHNNLIDLEKFDFGKFFEDKDSYVKRNKSLLLLDMCNNSTSAAWLENFEKTQNAEKFFRKDSEGNIMVHGYNVNNTNVILYRRDLSNDANNTGNCQIM